MASVIAYYRPRGIQGNYKVGIYLDLKPTEQAEVHRRTYPTSPATYMRQKIQSSDEKTYANLIKPIHTIIKSALFKKETGKILIYVLLRFAYEPNRESIFIQINDLEIAKPQNSAYNATSTGIEERLRGEIDSTSQEAVKQSIELNKITLVDLDIPNNPQLQQFKSEIRQLQQFMQ